MRRSVKGWALAFAGMILWGRLAEARAIVIGSIREDPTAEIEKFAPIAAYLSKNLISEGIDNSKVEVSRTIPEMATLMREKKVDIYFGSPFPTLAVQHLSHTRLLLRRWKHGLSEYRCVIFARKDSGLHGLKDLRGRKIVFKDPYSSSGYYLPRIAFLKEQVNIVHLKDPLESVGPDDVGYVFSGGEENTVFWVLQKKVQAGAIDDDRFVREAKTRLGELDILYRSMPIPRHIVSVRSDLDPVLTEKIKKVLMQMNQSEEGRRLLKDFQGTTQFDELPADALDALTPWQGWINKEFGSPH